MRDRRMAETLQPRQTHHGQQRADVEARRGRIESDVGGDAARRRAPPRSPSVESWTSPRHVSSSNTFAIAGWPDRVALDARRATNADRQNVYYIVDGRHPPHGA